MSSNIKAIIYDLDGMLFKEPHFFTKEMECQYGVPVEESMFHKDPNYRLCKIGQINIDEFLEPYFEKWKKYPKFDISPEDFKKHWYEFTKPIQEVHELAKGLREQGITNLIVTDNFKERIDYIRKKYNLDNNFVITGSFELGVLKTDPDFIDKFKEKINIPTENILVFDDKETNVERLQNQGFQAYIYHNLEDFYSILEKGIGLDL